MRHRGRKVDMAETLAANLRLNNLNTTTLTHHTAVLHALIFSTDALVVFYGSEDLRAEESVSLGLVRSVVDGLWLLYLAVRPLTNLLGASNTDADC